MPYVLDFYFKTNSSLDCAFEVKVETPTGQVMGYVRQQYVYDKLILLSILHYFL
jgi:hypothetical protein